VTRLTSLVAVDRTVTRPAGEPLRVSELPLNLPAGWDFEKVFGERAKALPAAAPIERRAEERDGRMRVAMRGGPATSPSGQPQPSVMLPATATDAEWKMIAGAVLMAFALVLAHRRRRVFG
jgi:Ca-activated chloride channel homolog